MHQTYKITQISQAKKRESRVNVYLDGQFWIGLDKNDLIKFQLLKDKELQENEKILIEKEARNHKLIDKVMNYMMIRPRSVKEIRDYLKLKNQIDSEETEKIIAELEQKNLLSDLDFAKWYTDNRLASGFHGPNKIRSELLKKGVSNTIIKSVLDEKQVNTEEDQQEKIKEYIKKVSKSIKAKDKYEFKNKLIQRLMSRGYGYDQVKKILADEE